MNGLLVCTRRTNRKHTHHLFEMKTKQQKKKIMWMGSVGCTAKLTATGEIKIKVEEKSNTVEFDNKMNWNGVFASVSLVLFF